MSLLNPSALWLGLLLPVIVAFYFLKLRRKEMPVSSIYLWQSMLRDLQANAPWQRLHPNLLLFLQLLFLLAIILATLRPFIWTEGLTSQTGIFIFDISASMAASDISPSRLDAAKIDAQKIVARMPGNAKVTVITAGSQPRTLISQSADRTLIYQAIQSIQPLPVEANLSAALQIAGAIARRQMDAETILFTDGSTVLTERTALPGNFQIRTFGSEDQNQAISVLTVEPEIGGSFTVFAQVANYASSPVDRRITILADGVPVSVSDLTIQPLSTTPVIVPEVPDTTLVVEARLSHPTDSQDYLSIDDAAFAVARQQTPIKAALIGPGNLFLETALSLIPGLELQLLDPSTEPDPSSQLLIYDRTIPESYSKNTAAANPSVGKTPTPASFPTANILFIAPTASTSLFTITGKFDHPSPTIVEPVDPLVEELDISSVSILDTPVLALPYWAKPLLVDAAVLQPAVPLLFTGEIDAQRVAVISFDLERSDLPLQIAFPILISRLVGWLAPNTVEQVPALVAPGEPVRITFNPSSKDQRALQVYRPDGTIANVELEDGRALFEDTIQLGLYRLIFPDLQVAYFAVNLFSPGESTIAPKNNLTLVNTSTSTSGVDMQPGKQEFWRILTLIGLFLLLAEWAVYYRATVGRIIQETRAWLFGKR